MSGPTIIEMLIIDPRSSPEDWGLILGMIDPSDPRPAREQLDEGYQPSGWHPQEGFKFNPKTGVMSYPGDPPFSPLSAIPLRDEMIVLYPYSYVAIIQKDSKFEIARMD
jgi:hypothetical protein